MDIVIDDNDVIQADEDLLVVEERYKESSELYLTKEQVVIELTNLLLDYYKHNVHSHVDTYRALMNKEHLNNGIRLSNMLTPVVEYQKTEYYHDPEFRPDAVFEKENQVKHVEFVSFLNQLHKLMKAKEGGYSGINDRLDKLFTPFTSTSVYDGESTDAYRINAKGDHENARLLRGDPANLKGFFTVKSDPKHKAFATFDWDVYKREVDNIKQGDDVHLVMNDFVFDGKRTVYDIKGKVTRVSDGTIHVTCTNDMKMKYSKEAETFQFFIYPVDTENFKYSKLSLLSQAVYIKNTPADKVLPTTHTEVLFIVMYMIQQDARNFHDIYNAISKVLDIKEIRLHHSASTVLRRILERKYPSLSVVSNKGKVPPHPIDQPGFLLHNVQVPSELEGSFGDTDIQRYKLLHRHLENEHQHILRTFENFIKKSKPTQEDTLKAIKPPSKPKEQTCADDSVRLVIAKQYSNIKDLQADNGKKIYFDSDLDPTDYKKKAEDISRDVKFTAKDLEFELATIAKGKRRVRENDHCLLVPDTLYVWKRVEGSGMWIKKRKYPFKICVDDLRNIDISQDNACVFDMYDKVCKTLKHVRENLKYNNYINKTHVLKGLVEYSLQKDSLLNRIQEDIKSLQARYMSSHETYIKADLGKLPSLDLEEFFENGEEHLGKDIMLNFEDQDHYAYMNTGDEHKSAPTNVANHPSKDFVHMMTTFMDLKVNAYDIEYICNRVEQNTQRQQNIQDGIEKERKRLAKSIDMTKYESNPSYRTAVDKLVNEKLAAFQEKAYSDMYYDIAVYAICMLSLTLMAKYPKVLLQSIYPSCVRYMSYQGHPHTDISSPKTINKYLVCLVKGITSGADGKYDKIQSKNLEDMTKDVVRKVDEILEKDASLKLRVDANRLTIQNANTKPTERKFKKAFPGFRPSPDIFKSKDKRTSNSIANALKNLNKVIQKSKHLKANAANIPQLLNACCLEKVDDVHSYYDFFGDDHPTKALKTSALMQRNKVHIPKVKTRLHQDAVNSFQDTIQRYKAKSAYVYEHVYKHVPLESKISFIAQDLSQDLSQDISQDIFWDEYVFPRTLETYDIIMNYISKAYDGCDAITLDAFRPVLIMIKDIGDVDTLRHCIYHHMVVKMNRDISSIVSKRVPEDSWKMSLITNKNVDIKQWQAIINEELSKVKTLFFEEDAIKNVSILSYVYVQCLHELLCRVVLNKSSKDALESELSMSLIGASESQKDVISLVSRYIYEDIHKLLSSIQTNDVDASVIRQRVEELREQRKQELIGMYRIDDEERQLQMALRKIGVDTWYDVGENEEKDVYVDIEQPAQYDIMKQVNQKEEDENYNMKGYQGENADANEVDEDYASAYMFSPDIS